MEGDLGSMVWSTAGWDKMLEEGRVITGAEEDDSRLLRGSSVEPRAAWEKVPGQCRGHRSPGPCGRNTPRILSWNSIAFKLDLLVLGSHIKAINTFAKNSGIQGIAAIVKRNLSKAMFTQEY